MIKTKSQIDKRLDDAWSLAVKLLANNQCEKCAKQNGLNSHHVYSRSKVSTRWSLSNGVCLCVSHHTLSSSFSAHKTPIEFTEWIKQKRGEKWYDALRLDAHKTVKTAIFEKEIILKNLLELIQELKTGKSNIGIPVYDIKN